MLIWGTTFIVTKNLMDDFNAAEILLTRFVVAFIVLGVVRLVTGREPLPEKHSKKDELYFIGCGITGLFLYGTAQQFHQSVFGVLPGLHSCYFRRCTYQLQRCNSVRSQSFRRRTCPALCRCLGYLYNDCQKDFRQGLRHYVHNKAHIFLGLTHYGGKPALLRHKR